MGPYRWCSDRRLWWMVFACVTVWGAAFGLSGPPLSAGDEIMHTIKTYSVARGQLVADPHPLPSSEVPIYGPEMAIYEVPRVFLDAGQAECYRGHSDIVPSCYSFANDDQSSITHWYPDNRYQPVYYALVGLPARPFAPGAASAWASRVVSVALAAALLASSVLSVRRMRGRRVAVIGLLVAVTPTVVALTGTLNPSVMEIAAAIACWSTGLALVTEVRAGRADPLDGRLLLRVATAASLLVLSRPSSPLFFLAIATVVGTIGGWRSLARALRQPRVQATVAAVGAAAALSVGWYVAMRPILVGWAPPGDTSDIVRGLVGKAGLLYQRMIGQVGVPDYEAPQPILIVWTAMLGGLAVLALLFARRRVLVMSGVLTLAVILLPMVMDLAWARTIGPNWHANYTMPLAVGIPIVLGFAAGERAPTEVLTSRRMTTAVGVLVAIAQIMWLWQFLRRYTVGGDGIVAFWTEPQWQGALPPLAALLIGSVACVSFVTVTLIANGGEPHARVPASVAEGVDAPERSSSAGKVLPEPAAETTHQR